MENLTSIAIFAAVVENGSFAAAAEKLGIVRSVASRRVNLLEQELKTRLLHRTTRTIALTSAGQRFYRKISDGLNAIREAESELSAAQDEPSGKLVVGVPMSFGLMHVLPCLPNFRLSNPGIELELRLDDVKSNLIKDGIDIALRIADLADSSLIARRLTVIRHVVVASAAYLGRRGIPREPLELIGHDCLVYTLKSSPQRWQFERAETNTEVDVQGSISANNSLAIREMLLAGMGIALVPIYLVAQDLRRGHLMEILQDWKTPELELCLIYPTRQHVPSTVRAFISFIEKTIGKSDYWDRDN